MFTTPPSKMTYMPTSTPGMPTQITNMPDMPDMSSQITNMPTHIPHMPRYTAEMPTPSSCVPYGNIYQPTSIAKLDNRRFFKTDCLLYESAPRDIVYVPDMSVEERTKLKNYYIYEKPKPKKEVKEDYIETYIPEKKERKEEKEGDHVCSVDADGVKNICGNNKNLFPIMDPRFNLREAAKNLILLEDHLFHEGKRCKDCILKHCLTIEGFLEEAITLDINQEYRDIILQSNGEFRQIFKELIQKMKTESLMEKDCCMIAQQLRRIRKPLCQQYGSFLQE